MRFLFDVDGVCADLISKLLEELNKNFPSGVPKYQDILSHDLLDRDKSILNKYQLLFAIELMCKEGFVKDLKVIPGCLEAITALRSAGHEVMWVTAPFHESKTWCYDRLQWLKQNFNASSKDVIFASNKSPVNGDVFVDDKPSNVIEWQTQWPDGKSLCFKQPWNSNDGLNCVDWSDIQNMR